MVTRYINPDKNRVKTILSGLKYNEEKYGQRYCPCKINKIEENICPCNEYRSTGICKCNLYTKPLNVLDIVYYMHESFNKYKRPLCFFEPNNMEKICPCREYPCYYVINE